MRTIAVYGPNRWYNRLTLNQERELEAAIGSCKGLSYKDALNKVLKSRKSIDKDKLVKIVMKAAEDAGCVHGVPLVDERLIEKLREERDRSRYEQRYSGDRNTATSAGDGKRTEQRTEQHQEQRHEQRTGGRGPVRK